MLERLLRFAVDHRVLVVLLALLAGAFGARALLDLPIDAVPDITNNQVQINIEAPSLSPEEVERRVTLPLEVALAGTPGLDYTRSLSRNGFAQITAVFHDRVDIYLARQLIAERLQEATESIPSGVEPQLGPIATGLGEVYMYAVDFAPFDSSRARGDAPGWQPDGRYLTPEGQWLSTAEERLTYLRTVQDWIIAPRLSRVPQVAAVDAIGGFERRFVVQPDSRELLAYSLTTADLVEALEANNLNSGAGTLEIGGEAWVVRGEGRLQAVADLADIVVGTRQGAPIRLRQVADVTEGTASRTGSGSHNGEESVIGTAIMLLGANSRTVAAGVDAAMTEIRPGLPPDIEVTTLLNRMKLVDATIHTVEKNLTEGALLVIVVLFLLLGNIRAALIAALAIPLSMLYAAIGMRQLGISGNLMSLGALDFGLIVDGAVIIVENCLRVLGERQKALGRLLTQEERLQAVFEASRQVRSATAFGEAIIITVYIPILMLTGVEGKMFQPMAATVICALIGAFILSLTLVPALVALWVTGPVSAHEHALIGPLQRLYRPTLLLALRWRWGVVAAALSLVLVAGLVWGSLGREFIPTLDEQDVAIHALRIPSTGLAQSTAMQLEVEATLLAMPEVMHVFSKTGTAEVASDPMPPSVSDTFVILHPRRDWPAGSGDKRALLDRMTSALQALPGHNYEFTQPIEMRFNELIAGVRSDVALKLYGDDFAQLEAKAAELTAVLGRIPGAADVRADQVSGLPVMTLTVDRAALSRYGLHVADVHQVLQVAVAGTEAGDIYDGDRRIPILVRAPEALRTNLEALHMLPVPLHGSEDAGMTGSVPLGMVAQLSLSEGVNQVTRENGRRRLVVQANVRGRDLGSFVEEAQGRVRQEVELPAGMWIEWGGQYENLESAASRLRLVVPLCFALILLLLYTTLGTWRHALLVFVAVPLALTGGIGALVVTGQSFSISAAVGCIALSGIAVLNGLVLVTFINQLRAGGRPLEDAILEGCAVRLRPVLMTALVASLGFLPMALAHGTGAEVQRPIATVVIGGLISATLLTLVVLPALYRLTEGWAEGRSQRA